MRERVLVLFWRTSFPIHDELEQSQMILEKERGSKGVRRAYPSRKSIRAIWPWKDIGERRYGKQTRVEVEVKVNQRDEWGKKRWRACWKAEKAKRVQKTMRKGQCFRADKTDKRKMNFAWSITALGRRKQRNKSHLQSIHGARKKNGWKSRA